MNAGGAHGARCDLDVHATMTALEDAVAVEVTVRVTNPGDATLTLDQDDAKHSLTELRFRSR